MAIITKFVDGQPSAFVGSPAVDTRRIRARFSSSAIDRSGDIVEQRGIDFTNYMRNPIVLLNHDKTRPIATCVECGIGPDGNLCGTIQFPDAGVSRLSDDVLGLIRAKIYNAISIGFQSKASEPIDRANPKRGMRYRSTELWEVSVVSVPAQADALIYEREIKPPRPRVAGSVQADAKATVERMKEAARLRLAGDAAIYRAADLALLKAADPAHRTALLEVFAAAGLDVARFPS